MKKNIKKVFLMFTGVALAFGIASCDSNGNEAPNPSTTAVETTDEMSEALKTAKNYVFSLYRSVAETVTGDLTRIAVFGDATIEWSVNVGEDKVKVVPANDGKTVAIQIVDNKNPDGFAFVLTAKISIGDESTTLTWNHSVAAFKELSYEEYVATPVGDSVVIKGTVTAILGKSIGNSYNCLYLQDNDGGYYIYSMEADPAKDTNLKIGSTVRVSGLQDNYSGTLEVKNGSYEILDDAIKTVTPKDVTSIFSAAETISDKSLQDLQSQLVTIKNVVIDDIDTANSYYNFTLNGKKSYIRISSSVCPMNKDDQATFKANHAEKKGYIANVTGIVSLFSGAFYLTPVDLDCEEYIGLPEKTPAEQVAFEKESLNVSALTYKDIVMFAGDYTLPTKGTAYENVTITWASNNAAIAIDGSKATVTIPTAQTTVKLTATLVNGSVTDTKEFNVVVRAENPECKNSAWVVEEVNKLEKGKTSNDYYFIKAIVGTEPTADYCNFNLDDTAVVVYGLYANAADRYGTKRQISEIPFTLGYEVVIYGQLQNYYDKSDKQTLEVVNALLISAKKVENPALEYITALDKKFSIEPSIAGAKTIALPTSLADAGLTDTEKFAGLTAAWSVSESQYASISSGNLVLTQVTAETSITLTLTISDSNGVLQTKNYTTKLIADYTLNSQADVYEIADKYESGKISTETVYVTGAITGWNSNKKSIYIQNSAGEAYYLFFASAVNDDFLVVGKQIDVMGNVEPYNNQIELVNCAVLKTYDEKLTFTPVDMTTDFTNNGFTSLAKESYYELVTFNATFDRKDGSNWYVKCGDKEIVCYSYCSVSELPKGTPVVVTGLLGFYYNSKSSTTTYQIYLVAGQTPLKDGRSAEEQLNDFITSAKALIAEKYTAKAEIKFSVPSGINFNVVTAAGSNFVVWDGETNTLTILPEDTLHTESIKLVASIGEVSKEESVDIVSELKAFEVGENQTAKIVLPAANVTPSKPTEDAGYDFTADLGLNTNVFKVLGYANDANMTVIYTDSIRLYVASKNGGSIVFSVNNITGYNVVINSISGMVIQDTYNAPTVLVGGEAVEAVEGVYAINAQSFTLKNTIDATSKNQCRVTALEINYSIVAVE